MVLLLSLSLAMLQGGLQGEIRSVQPPQGQTVLVVGPERIPATDGGSGAGLPGIAKRYGRMLYTSGNVVSLAPATMKTILAPPKEPNPFLGLNPRDAFKLLAARLDGRQWSALVGENGLGMSDLKSTDERFLFEALVKPGGELLIFPSVVNRSESKAATIDLTASAAQSRLRLGTTIQPMIPDGLGGFMGSIDSVSYNVDLGEAAPDGKIMGGANVSEPSEGVPTGLRIERFQAGG
ncbi:hypothetical protein EON81_22440 [bacterium]|nr:MAG: hypothetical protein EON81_22440 [bacterium]